VNTTHPKPDIEKLKAPNRVPIDDSVVGAVQNVLDELARAIETHGRTFASMHEAHSVILEELEEFWEEVRKKKSERSQPRMRFELCQIAAMAIKAMLQNERGTV
jgi:thiamine pyrophosphate-dependent acetolactate synthase large subunit-like protein